MKSPLSLGERGADLFELFGFPLEGEAFALRGLDGLDAAGVVVLNKDAAPVRPLDQGEVVAIAGDDGILLSEGIDIETQKSCDRLRLARLKRDIPWHAAAGAAALTGKRCEC